MAAFSHVEIIISSPEIVILPATFRAFNICVGYFFNDSNMPGSGSPAGYGSQLRRRSAAVAVAGMAVPVSAVSGAEITGRSPEKLQPSAPAVAGAVSQNGSSRI